MSYEAVATSMRAAYGDGRPNRIKFAIDKMKANIDQRLAAGLVTRAKVDTLHKSLDMEPVEFCKFQELKSLASVTDTLTPEEAQFIYALLGDTPDTFNAQPIEVKVILTQVFKELLERRIAKAA